MDRLAGFLFLLSFAFGQQSVQYVHLAFTGNVTEMVVGWYTQAATNESVVQFGSQSNQLDQSAYGAANSWREGYGYNHFVLLTGLKPNTEYYYVCGDPSGGWSNQTSFMTQPLKEAGPFTIGIWGDMGITNSENTMARVIERGQKGEFDWIFHVGDISYADDHVFSFQSTWNSFFQSMQPLMTRYPYMVVPGNHEWASRDPFLYFATRNFVVYNHRFMMPSANPQAQSMYYSFDYANVHIISMSTETSYPNAPYGSAGDFGDELAWLEADLQEANLPENRKIRPWIIVMGHRPIYSSAVGYSKNGVPINSILHPSNSLTLQETFEDLFYKYHVDIAFNGHVHSYERNYPTYKNKRTSGYENPKSTFNIVIGNGGNIEGKEQDWTTPQPEWSGFRFGSDYGYGLLTISNDTHLEWSFYSASDNVLRDQVNVVKN